MNDAHTRIDEIDIVKALAIILMIADHGGCPSGSFLFLFFVSVFFMASGYFYKPEYSRSSSSVWKFIKRRIKGLWLPFFIFNSIFALCHNLFIRMHIYTDDPTVFFYLNGGNASYAQPGGIREMLTEVAGSALFITHIDLAGAFWFLKILFGISILYCCIDFVLSRFLKTETVLICQGLLSLVFLMCGYSYSALGTTFHGLELTLSYYCLFFMGLLLRAFNNRHPDLIRRYDPLFFVLSLLGLIALRHCGLIYWNGNSYVNPAFLLATSLCGWIWLYSISSFLCAVPQLGILRKMLTCVGRHTLAILLLHLLCFKIVACIICGVYGLPLICVAAYPNLYGYRGAWWLAYILVGVSVPVLLDISYRNCRAFLRNKIAAKSFQK